MDKEFKGANKEVVQKMINGQWVDYASIKTEEDKKAALVLCANTKQYRIIG